MFGRFGVYLCEFAFTVLSGSVNFGKKITVNFSHNMCEYMAGGVFQKSKVLLFYFWTLLV